MVEEEFPKYYVLDDLKDYDKNKKILQTETNRFLTLDSKIPPEDKDVLPDEEHI